MNNTKTIEYFETNDRLNKFKDSVSYVQEDGSVLIMFGDTEEHEDLCLLHVCNENILNSQLFPQSLLESYTYLEIKRLHDSLFYNTHTFNRESAVEMLARMTVKDYYEIVSGLFLEKWTDYFEHDFVLSDDDGRNLYIKTVGVDTDEDFYYQMFFVI